MNGHLTTGNASKLGSKVYYLSWRLGWNPYFRNSIWDNSRIIFTRRYLHFQFHRVL